LNFFAFHGGGLFVHLHDVAHYYLGAKYYGQLDHGFNATPVWTLIGRPFARSVPASDSGLLLLALLDPLLIAGMLLTIAWAFGVEAISSRPPGLLHVGWGY
jgi:hypothetical protein